MTTSLTLTKNELKILLQSLMLRLSVIKNVNPTGNKENWIETGDLHCRLDRELRLMEKHPTLFEE